MERLAKSIRYNYTIQGITISKTSYKINRFAYDVILVLTDVEKSLPKVTATLKLFGELSYYKVNTSKSVILSINFPSSTINKLK